MATITYVNHGNQELCTPLGMFWVSHHREHSTTHLAIEIKLGLQTGFIDQGLNSAGAGSIAPGK